MSASYTLHVSPFAAPGDPEALAQADLVRDGFSWWAFLVPPLWFAGHRHWIVALGLLIGLVAFWFGLRLAGLPAGANFAANVLLYLLIGHEAASLRRWDYARQGRPAVDVVFAANEAEAEQKSFTRWLSPASVASVPVLSARTLVSAPWRRPDESHVIGLFPDLERRR